MALDKKWIAENKHRIKTFEDLVPKEIPLFNRCEFESESLVRAIQDGYTTAFWVENHALKQEVKDTWDVLPIFSLSSPYFIKDNLIMFQGENRVRVMYKSCNSPKIPIDHIYDLMTEVAQQEDTYKIGLLVNDYGDLVVRYFNLKLDYTIDVEKHFNDDFKEFADDMVINLSSRKKGLYLLHGVPGTGKTSFIKYLTKTIRRNFIFVPLNMTSALSSPDILNILMDHQDAVIVLEDCSKELIAREDNGSPDSVSNLLNMTDGILADALHMTFIATVNMDIAKIDNAILRSGRCIGSYEFEKLNVDKCKALGFDVDEPTTLAQLYNGKGVGQISKRKKIGF